jgi:hypothetical protein
MMQTLARKISEVENKIKRQNALKLLSADHQQKDALHDSVSSLAHAQSQTLATRICTEFTDHQNRDDPGLLI